MMKNKKIIYGIGLLVLILALGFILWFVMFATTDQISPDTEVKAFFFPTQKEPASVYMAALLSDKPEELVVDDNGCLRAGGYLFIWPYGFSLTDIDGAITVVDNAGKPVVSVGDKIEVSGGEASNKYIAKYFPEVLNNRRCPGLYWIVGYEITRIPAFSVEPTKEMVEKIIFYENGKQQIIDLKSEDGKGIASLLTRKLHELNLQATCVFGEEDIEEIKHKDRVAELIFKRPLDITISQWIEPEERYHIPVDEKGYRILENVISALFILEDNLDEGLESHILVGHEVEGRIGYSCWAININPEGKPELDKTWIEGINRLME